MNSCFGASLSFLCLSTFSTPPSPNPSPSSSSSSSNIGGNNDHEQEEEKLMMVITTTDHDPMRKLDKPNKQKLTTMKKKKKKKNRPENLIIMPVQTYNPDAELEFEEAHKRMMESKEVEVQGQDFCLASKKGRRQVMEDGYGVLTNILGHSSHGGYVLGGRVQATLAVSRAIGDLHLKEWVISEPEMGKVELSPDCQFLVMASDGLWDKVGEQEAVDEVSRHIISSNSNNILNVNGGVMESCQKLVELAFSRGNLDDATVMVVSLANFVQPPLFNGS